MRIQTLAPLYVALMPMLINKVINISGSGNRGLGNEIDI